jgi:hypothetical protein
MPTYDPKKRKTMPISELPSEILLCERVHTVKRTLLSQLRLTATEANVATSAQDAIRYALRDWKSLLPKEPNPKKVPDLLVHFLEQVYPGDASPKDLQKKDKEQLQILSEVCDETGFTLVISTLYAQQFDGTPGSYHDENGNPRYVIPRYGLLRVVASIKSCVVIFLWQQSLTLIPNSSMCGDNEDEEDNEEDNDEEEDDDD